ncbi:SDR family oxidoreductase [Neisseria sp. Ec49-e6-T10]|uniref:SDR family oxidoreductase n=1 Tax=Neisseria sp. Ec49-e6-T10 TaxID=3140744 RepID=UPI003EBE3586
MNSILDKVIIITGASSGIGEKTARLLAKKGAILVLAARRKGRIDKLAQEIIQNGGKAISVETDVTSRADVNNLIEQALNTYGRIDVLVNNAGIMSIAPLNQIKVVEWDTMIDVNIKGVLYGIAATLPIFEKQQSGHFINISSVAGLKVFSPGGTVYSGTKFAVAAISEGLRHEVGAHIRTTTIFPGAIDSELKLGSSDTQSIKNLSEFYQHAISASSVSQAIAFAIEQPADVDINEIVLRPTSQGF